MADEYKKKFGMFYTSAEVVDYILDCIGFVTENSIEDATIIDPSCGEGVFLVKAAERLLKRLENKGFNINNPVDAETIIRTVVKNIHGIDVNVEAIRKTEENLFSVIKKLYETVKAKDQNYKVQFKIYCFDALLPNRLDGTKFDFVIGNPPYIRIQRIKPKNLKERYRQGFQAAVGRFDISVLFIERGIKWLKPSGKLGFIVSNKFIKTNYGRGIREYILKTSSLEHIFDLTDIQPFQVAVLPCVLTLKKEVNASKYFSYCTAKKVKQNFKTKNISNLFEFVRGQLKEKDFTDIAETVINGNKQKIIIQCFETKVPSESNAWSFVSPSEFKIVEKITKMKTHFLDDLAEKINVGIKTTSNSVFANPLTEAFIKENAMEREIIHPCLRGGNIHRWKITWNGNIEKKDTFLIYPHEKQKNKIIPVNLDSYPNIKKYLELHRKELEDRYYIKDAGRQWYEIWVHQDPNDFNQMYKILTSDLSSHNTFALDENMYFCLDSCYYIILKEKSEINYKFLLGLLNSKVLEFIHKKVCSTHVYSNKYRYMTSYLKKYPIVFTPNSTIGKAIIEIVDKILNLSSESHNEELISMLESRLNDRIYSLYQLDITDRSFIESALAIG